MYTTIKISTVLKKRLDAMKVTRGETYEDLLLDLVEDHLSINERTKKELSESFSDYRRGKGVSLGELKRKAGLDV
jgi:hypothetical protein